MKPSLFAASTVAVLGVLSIGADARAQSCSETALDTARALATQYCETVKDADVDRVVIRPALEMKAVMTLLPACTRTHSLICKQHMASLVSQDPWCVHLYEEEFYFTFKDEFTGSELNTSSQYLYDQLQWEGCKLH
ncbi:hypothetical protein [Sorangium sp. So ce1335]|uniref:hypothetical protein n=1 Tax=Sorangium sp. So ce1335 TaxID=3133335 RepID=UPI003F630588